MKPRLSTAALLLALALAGAAKPLALRVEVEPLGQGQAGTVVGVLLQIAPEDRARAGKQLRVTTSLIAGDTLVDRQTAVVDLEADGTALLYRELKPGEYELRVGVAGLEGEAEGLWVGEVHVAAAENPFTAPSGAPPDAVALELATPPAQDAVRFKAPEEGRGIGAIQLEVEVPAATATVEFMHDGHEVGRRNRPPWTVSVPLGEIVRRTTVTAIARDAQRHYLGEDAFVLNPPGGQLALEILLAPEDTIRDGKRAVTVAVSGGGPLSQVSLQLDDRPIARWADCPCVVEVPVAELGRAVVLSADAVDAKGTRGDAVLTLAQGTTFSATVTVELVELPVIVLDERGVPVVDLTRDDFTVFEDDQPVAIEGFGTTADTELSLALAVDVSGSMYEEIQEVRTAVGGFASDLVRPGDQVSLLVFSWDTAVEVPWTKDADAIRTRLDRVQPEGGTSLRDAVVRSLEQFRGRRGRQALVLLTDGEDTTSRTGEGTAERFVRTMRIPIFPIGLGVGRLSFASHRVLDDLARETGGTGFYPKKPDELPAVYGKIGQLLRSQYLLWYHSGSSKPPTELRTVRVEVAKSGLKVQTIRGYFPGR